MTIHKRKPPSETRKSPDLSFKAMVHAYIDYLWREANARVDAGGIPEQWSKPGGAEIAFAYFKKVNTEHTGADKIIRGLADEAIRLGDRNSIAEHLELGSIARAHADEAIRLGGDRDYFEKQMECWEVYPKMQEFIAKAFRSPQSKFANRPPRLATRDRHVWMARFVALELAPNPSKPLTEIYNDISRVFRCESRTVANAHRKYKTWIEFQNERLIDIWALQMAVQRAHP